MLLYLDYTLVNLMLGVDFQLELLIDLSTKYGSACYKKLL